MINPLATGYGVLRNGVNERHQADFRERLPGSITNTIDRQGRRSLSDGRHQGSQGTVSGCRRAETRPQCCCPKSDGPRGEEALGGDQSWQGNQSVREGEGKTANKS
jgi:hypothetical protein